MGRGGSEIGALIPRLQTAVRARSPTDEDRGITGVRFPVRRTELRHMEQHTTRKTYKYRLLPTPEQEQVLETVLWRCRALYNAALEQRKTWWERGQGVGATYYQQNAELPDLKGACPEFAEVHAHVLQDVILRVERAFQAFFRRVQAGEEPGYPRFH